MNFVSRHSTALVAILVVLFLAIGLAGISFGYHWDEPVMVWQVRYSIENRLLLPTGVCNPYWPNLKGGNYEYPTVLYWIAMASALPEIIHRGIHELGPANSITDRYSFLIRLRIICLILTAPLLVWVYRSARTLVTRAGSAVFAAALVAGCWEFAYHCRFVATDALMTQFAGGVLMCCLAAIRTADPVKSRRWLIAAAVFTGLATGTKYPGGMLAVPLMAAGWLAVFPGDGLPGRGSPDDGSPGDGSVEPSPRYRRRFKRVAKLIALQMAVFLITTPGAVLQPWNFGAWVWYDHMHYGVYGHGSHTIRNHVAHLSAILQYLTLTLFSPSPWVSVPIAGLCVIGAVRLLWSDRRAAAVLLVFPVLYVAYFTTQVAEIVRNLLVLVPFLIVTAAVGVDTLFDGIDRIRGRSRAVLGWSLSGALATSVLFSLAWQSFADAAIVGRAHANANRYPQALAYLTAHKDLAVYPTETAARELDLPLFPPNTGGIPVVIGFTHEKGTDEPWPANIFHFARATFGVPEVNFIDYPDWFEDAIVIADMSNARRVPSVQVERAVGRYDRSVGVPAGYVLGPYLSAGGPDRVESGGVTIRCLQSAVGRMPLIPAASMPDGSSRWVDPQAVSFEIDGLQPGRAYVIGWTGWDESGGRRESVSVEPTTGPAEQIQPPTALPRWTADQPSPHWPPPAVGPGFVASTATLPPAAHPDGRSRVVFHRDAGPDVGVSSVWIDVPK